MTGTIASQSAPRVLGAPSGQTIGKTAIPPLTEANKPMQTRLAKADGEDPLHYSDDDAANAAPAYGPMDLAHAMEMDPSLGGIMLGNRYIVPIRGTGTGTAIRPSVHNGEVAYRAPENWRDRAYLFLGAPCVIEHPESGMLNSETFAATCVGTVIHAFWSAEEEEIVCICSIIDMNAAELIQAGVIFDASPSVTFSPDNVANAIEVNGVKVLFEGVGLAVDHLALLIADGSGANRGVWSRQTTPAIKQAGVE
jgi:hypothetical protein